MGCLGAAYLLQGGGSDDGFDYFRAWLIAQGRTIYENTLEDLDSLADVVTVEQAAEFNFEAEAMLCVGWGAYEARTGRSIWHDIPERLLSLPFQKPAGDPWEDDEQLDKQYPRLAALEQAGYELWKSRRPDEDEEDENE